MEAEGGLGCPRDRHVEASSIKQDTRGRKPEERFRVRGRLGGHEEEPLLPEGAQGGCFKYRFPCDLSVTRPTGQEMTVTERWCHSQVPRGAAGDT